MIIFIVGPAAVGKTHFCKCWLKHCPKYIRIDDLPVVLEYIELDKILVDGNNIKKAREELCKFENKATYLKTEAAAYQRELDVCGNIPTPRFTKEIDGGFRAIADPNIWDEIMRKIASGLFKDSSYLVEFARGIDPNYLKLHGITEREIYPKSIECFLDWLDGIMAHDIGIIHIGASCEQRRRRNLERRKTTGQFLPDMVFEKVFKNDAFFRTSNDLSKTIETDEVLIGGNKVPVFSIMNELEKTPGEAERFLTQAACDATKFFGL